MTDWPITLEQAAERLHIRNLRWLRSLCKRITCGRRVPGDIIFDSADFERLYRSLPCPSTSQSVADTTISAGPSKVAIASRLRAQLKGRAPTKSGRSGKRNYLRPQ